MTPEIYQKLLLWLKAVGNGAENKIFWRQIMKKISFVFRKQYYSHF